MATGTLAPAPYQTVLDANGNPVSGAKINTYVAGTTTPAATYSDVALSVANTNPIIADSAGRYVAYLSPGASYKFVIQDASGASIRSQDNVSAVPASSVNLDVTGVAGETLTAGQAVYLSDGSGSKVAGSWYKTDSGQIYSSVLPQVGMLPAAIASGASGTIRLSGQVTGLSALVVGTTYYIGTAGTLTATAPPLQRALGVADTTSSLVLTANPPKLAAMWADDFRLTLTTATPVTTADVTAATTLYCSPYLGNRIDLPDASGNPVRHTSVEFSIAVPASTSQLYDVFAFSTAGVATLELLAWTNDSTRATTVTRTNGRYFKTGDATRLYLGSFRTTTVSGQTEDSLTKRYVWNYYNRIRRALHRHETTNGWTYTTATIRQANGAAANQIDVVVGIAEVMLDLDVSTNVSNSTGGINVTVGIGEDSTSSLLANILGGDSQALTTTGQVRVSVRREVPVGRHFYPWLEFSAATGTTTWGSQINVANSGLNGSIDG